MTQADTPEPWAAIEQIREALIDAHPGPLSEHDAMCASLFASKGECNCSVARNAAALAALGLLTDTLEAAEAYQEVGDGMTINEYAERHANLAALLLRVRTGQTP